MIGNHHSYYNPCYVCTEKSLVSRSPVFCVPPGPLSQCGLPLARARSRICSSLESSTAPTGLSSSHLQPALSRPNASLSLVAFAQNRTRAPPPWPRRSDQCSPHVQPWFRYRSCPAPFAGDAWCCRFPCLLQRPWPAAWLWLCCAGPFAARPRARASPALPTRSGRWRPGSSPKLAAQQAACCCSQHQPFFFFEKSQHCSHGALAVCFGLINCAGNSFLSLPDASAL